MKRIIVTFSLLVFAAFFVLAGSIKNTKFNAVDSNKDGFISQTEFTAQFPRVKTCLFFKIDLDKDGKISPAEWEAMKTP